MSVIKCLICGAVGNGDGADLSCMLCYEKMKRELTEARKQIDQYKNKPPCHRDSKALWCSVSEDLERAKAQIAAMRCCGNCRNSDKTARGIVCTLSSEHYELCLTSNLGYWLAGVSKTVPIVESDEEIM